MKKFVKHTIHFFLKKVKSRMAYVNLELLEEKRTKIINRFHAVGYDFRLNGKEWEFKHSEKMIFGNNIHVGNNAYFNGEGGLIVGDNTHFSRNVTIYTVNHEYEGRALPYDFQKKERPVSIGKNVWIGMNVSIIPGVIIGEGAIIGMGTVVNKDVAPFEIIGTSKIEVIKQRDIEKYKVLEQQRKYSGVDGHILNKEKINQFFPSYEEKRAEKIVFVLSTGRSGSTSIVDMLNQHPHCKAFHEDIRQLIRISTNLAYFPEKQTRYLSEINDIFSVKPWQASKDQVMIHSDQRLWNLVPFLKDYFPNSKFIHLKRKPVPSVLSMISRGWYVPNEYPKINNFDWSKFRLQGDMLKLFTEVQWDAFSNKQKCAWYWSYLNKSIESSLKDNLSKDRFITIDIEDIIDKSNEIMNFLEIPEFQFSSVKSNIRKKEHQGNYSKLLNNNIAEEILISINFFNKK